MKQSAMWKMNRIIALFFALTLNSVICNASGDFAYDGSHGPDHWREEYNTCGGKHQSPININVLDVVNRTFTPIVMQRFDEVPASAELANNGHTVVVKLAFEGNTPPTISGGPLEGKGTFQFSQFHFHWGDNNTVGSEDRINNVSFPAELHMVFRNTKYATFDDAVAQKDGLAVMAFFYALQEEDNTNYIEFTELLGSVRKPNMRVAFRNPPKLKELITKDIVNYFTYIGSLTTPPCSENVTWIDYGTPIMISEEQIQSFRRLYTHDGVPLTHNFRPIQPLNNRTIYRATRSVDTPMTVQSAVNVSSSASVLKFYGICIAICFMFNAVLRPNV